MRKVTFMQFYRAISALNWATYRHAKSANGSLEYITPANSLACSYQELRYELECLFGNRVSFFTAIPQYAPELAKHCVLLKSQKTLNQEKEAQQ